ncbi:hypothetical protein [Halegenticoccus soli]|uniref:hypothetical protein n=1 Tax=Halegenticoccus soli TaxID=1985678 RepID=UPI0018EE3AD0|nr:hypothetical protein [Halegenticoccus soli]
MSDEPPQTPPPTRKSTLFCQVCRHASLVDGDWRLRSAADGTVRYVCPECEHVIAERPSFGDEKATDGRGTDRDWDREEGAAAAVPSPATLFDPARWGVRSPFVAVWATYAGLGAPARAATVAYLSLVTYSAHLVTGRRVTPRNRRGG